MSIVAVPCAACGKSIRVPAGAGDAKVKCPHCQQVVALPRPRADAARMAIAPTVAPDAQTPSVDAPAGATQGLSQAGNDAHYSFLVPPQAPDELGRLGPYRVLKVLGAGGMGVVFKAEDPILQRPVALKALLPGRAASPIAKERFLREAKAAASIKHDHIIHIYQVGEDRGVPFLAMEFLDGQALDDRLEQAEPMPLKEVLRIGREIAEGLAAAHERGLIHRDIKPANIWLEAPRGRVKILDFGLARSAAQGSQLTQIGAIVGTPAFMAPEQAHGKEVDPRCDLFSLGCVLYRMATGSLPFKGADTVSTLVAVATHTPPAPKSVRADLPTPLSDLIMKLLAKNPGARPASARTVADALEALTRQQEAPPPARRASAVAKAARPAKRIPAVKKTPSAGDKRSEPRSCGVLSCTLLIVLTFALGAGALGLAWRFWWQAPVIESKLALDAAVPGVRVRVLQNGELKALLDSETAQEVSVPVGIYDLELVGGRDGLKLESDRVNLTAGADGVVKVAFEMPVTPGYRALFNGKDLTGWKTYPPQTHGWTVEKGWLTGRADHGDIYLFSERGDFSNFHLRAEVWVNDLGHGGLFFRAPLGLPVQGKYPGGYKAPIVNRSLDRKVPLTGSIYRHSELTKALVPPDEWFTLEVLAQMHTITTKVNEKLAVSFTDAKKSPLRGHLALQAMAPATTVVQFRKIEIKELPGPGAAPKSALRSLLNGKELAGWQSSGTGGWRVSRTVAEFKNIRIREPAP